MADSREIERIAEEICELKRRWPAHSAPPSMWDELERLEEELSKARKDDGGTGDAWEDGSGRLSQM